MSLWKVDDAATHDLMTAFYRALSAGRGRGEAMRLAQTEIARQRGRAHPFYWASFVVSGDWRGLEGQTTAPQVPAVARGARGCGCGAGGAPPASSLALIGLAIALASSRRARRAPRQR
jgi:MYXO-CTERM domain-containing protein